MTPGEVAIVLRISSKTLNRWDKAGRFPPGAVVRTLGGHRRYREHVIRAIVDGTPL